jgi:hypothetical protein
MSPNPADHFDTPLDEPDYDVPMDAPPPTSPNASELLDSGTLEDIQDDAALFNLDENDYFNHPSPPQATLKNLASAQTIIKQI